MTEALLITTSKRDDHQLALAIQLGPERTEEALRRAAKLVSKRAKIPGFRPGKAPYATVLRMFGRDALLGQVLDDLGDEVYKEALETEKIEPYGRAELEDVQTDPVTFKLVVPLQPTVDLGDYRSIRIEAPEISVSEADVEQMLEGARDQRATWQVVERPAEIEDTVIVDIHGTVGEDTIMDNHDWELVLKGSESGWLPGFDGAFVGMAAADEKTFTLTYPEDSASRYKGKEATFQATVKEVKSRVRPELDDEFARSLGDYADLADYRAKALAAITQQRTAAAEDELNDKAVEALIEKATLAYPPAAVERTLEALLSDAEFRASRAGYQLSDLLRLQGMTLEGYKEQLRPQAEQRLKGRLVLNELAKAEEITVTPEERQAELDRMVEGAESEGQAAAVREAFSSDISLRLIDNDLQTRKSLARLREIVTGTALRGLSQAQDDSSGQVSELPEPVEKAADREAPAVEAVTTETSNE